MSTLAEKRVFTEQDDLTRVLVAGSLGVVGVSVSGDLVGEFAVDHRCTARDLAARGDALAVATDEDVLVGDYRPTGHGPAVAVALHDAGDGTAVLAAAPDGTVSRLPPGALDAGGSSGGAGTGDGVEVDDEEGDGVTVDPDGDAWTALGSVDDPRRMDGPLVAAADGVHRVAGGGPAVESGSGSGSGSGPGSESKGELELEYAGLDDAHDVATGGVPLAAAGEALYTLGNGWMCALDGAFRTVATDAAGGRALAATADAVYERAAADGEWDRHDRACAADVAVAADLRVLVTGDGEVRVNRDGEWRGRALGVPEVAAVVVPESGSGSNPDGDGGSAATGSNSPE